MIKFPRMAREILLKSRGRSPRDFNKFSQGIRGNLITNFPRVMVFLCNTMITEEISK